MPACIDRCGIFSDHPYIWRDSQTFRKIDLHYMTITGEFQLMQLSLVHIKVMHKVNTKDWNFALSNHSLTMTLPLYSLILENGMHKWTHVAAGCAPLDTVDPWWTDRTNDIYRTEWAGIYNISFENFIVSVQWILLLYKTTAKTIEIYIQLFHPRF